jgi:hypothetical protein
MIWIYIISYLITSTMSSHQGILLRSFEDMVLVKQIRF